MCDGTCRSWPSALRRGAALVFSICCQLALPPCPHLAYAADWPQYMRNSEHTGDASDEELKLPLRLVAQVKLDDAVLTCPAVVGGRAYVADQMGAAYCIDPDSGRVVWKSSPDGERAMGSNTSSPCVTRGRVYYGTTAGSLHILDANDGRVVNSIHLGWPVTGSPTLAGGRIYLQTVGAVLHCFDTNGDEQWRWDHYKQYTTETESLKGRFPGSYHTPHYGGGEVAVSGKRVVTGIGWDHFCVEDRGDRAELLWCNRAALGKDDGIPMSAAISDGHVYTAWPGVDAAGSLLRVKLEDGSFARKEDQLGRRYWAILGTPAVRGATAFFGRTIRGVTAYEFGKGVLWESYYWGRSEGFTPVISSPALSKNHCVFTTMTGELIAVDLASRGSDLDRLKPAPYRFRTPYAKVSSSSPAISGGRVFFGSDDGHLYVLGPGGKRESRIEPLTLHERRTPTWPATDRRYDWPSPFGNSRNNGFVDDPRLKPPLRLRWAVRSFGMFKQQLSATEHDLVYKTMAGTVACVEQQSGRLRWRIRVPDGGYSGVLCGEESVFVPVPQRGKSKLVCLDLEMGETLWSRDTGDTHGSQSRSVPVLAAARVGFGYLKADGEKKTAVVEACDARTGDSAWQVSLKARGDLLPPTGSAIEGTMFFTSVVARPRGKDNAERRGETVAIDAKTGSVVWRTDRFYGQGTAVPVIHGERLYILGDDELGCLSCRTGEVEWTKKLPGLWFHGICVGPDYFTCRGYSGFAERWSLREREPERLEGKRILLGADAHACGPVVLTSGDVSIAISVAGLHIRDVNSGELLWKSMGFAPRTCSSAIPSNGRIFCNPQVNGMLYCFEPVAAASR